MEHLPLENSLPLLVVTYREYPGFDGKALWNRDPRCLPRVWDVADFIREHFSGDHIHQLEGFLQSWMFFGLLEAVTGITVDTALFTREDPEKGRVITTAKLPTLLRVWVDDTLKSERNMRRLHASASFLRLKSARDMMVFIKTAMTDPTQSLSKIQPGLPILLNLLIETLSWALNFMIQEELGLSIPADTHASQSEFFRRSLVSTGWCLCAATIAVKHLSTAGVLYALSLGPPAASRDH